jgi:hypothetical protein
MAGAAKITVAVEELVEAGSWMSNSYSWNIRATCFSGEVYEKRIEQRTVRQK